ncbi:LysR family transcriptional regulator [Paucibacter sp. R3-3]|uniref:LysR family transcriptional regulator n=1 Tax=Roseateles agri TaxID=3098619 RepID=A0ABU5DMY8_9BURK|nr:LysR family transcriptional regulator [Paucibacter sp. R3-3]MDY0747683.1 LysR family transcriptional regulator [Paucibacter sp. R3-3]
MKFLDIEAVHAFVVTSEFQSFTRAAELLGTTQPAVSLRIKRLEDGLGRKLLERTPRHVRLSADGAALLGSARALLTAHQAALDSFAPKRQRLLIGISHHVVGAELPQLLRSVGHTEPALALDVRIASSRELLQAFDENALDVAIVLRHDMRREDGDVVLEEAFGWFALPEFELRSGEALRLAVQPPPCSIRAMAVGALDAAGVPWIEAFGGGGVATIGAAVLAGLAVAALGRRVAPAGAIDVGPRLGLPSLPTRSIVMHTHLTDKHTRRAIRALVSAIRATGGR